MSDAGTITQLITEIGMPGAMAAGAGWMLYKVQQWHREERDQWQEKEDKRQASAEAVLEKNTDALTQLSHAIEQQNNRRRASDG